jgi:hypothetical protein
MSDIIIHSLLLYELDDGDDAQQIVDEELLCDNPLVVIPAEEPHA